MFSVSHEPTVIESVKKTKFAVFRMIKYCGFAHHTLVDNGHCVLCWKC